MFLLNPVDCCFSYLSVFDESNIAGQNGLEKLWVNYFKKNLQKYFAGFPLPKHKKTLSIKKGLLLRC
jgi:hypothetical protein